MNTYYIFSLEKSLRYTLHKNIPSTAANLRPVVKEPILQKRSRRDQVTAWAFYSRGFIILKVPCGNKLKGQRKRKKPHHGHRLPWGKFCPEFKSGEWFNPAYMKAE